MVSVIQAFRFALDPLPGVEAVLRSHCGGQRFAFNWGSARVKANLGQRAAEKSYGIADDGLTRSVPWSAYSLRKDWNQAKDQIAPWWAENSKEAYSSGLANLATALDNWADSTNGKRKGRRLGFPRFKGKRSTGETVPNPRHLEATQRGLRRQAARRVGPDRRTRRQPSQRWRKTQARIARLHTAVANARRDGLQKLSTRLVRTHGAVVVEDLNVAGMTRNRRLARQRRAQPRRARARDVLPESRGDVERARWKPT